MTDATASWNPSFRELYKRMGSTNAIDGLVPAAAFIMLNSVFGLAWGIGAAMMFSVGMILFRRSREERLNPMMWVTLGIIVVPGLVGILADSSDAFLAPPVIMGGLFALAMGISVLAGRPLMGVMVNGVFPMPDDLREAPTTRRSFSQLTLMWTVVGATSTVVQLLLLARLSPGAFVAVHQGLNIGTSVPMIAVSFWMLRRIAMYGRGQVAVGFS
jgi:intracellular septation protein A